MASYEAHAARERLALRWASEIKKHFMAVTTEVETSKGWTWPLDPELAFGLSLPDDPCAKVIYPEGEKQYVLTCEAPMLTIGRWRTFAERYGSAVMTHWAEARSVDGHLPPVEQWNAVKARAEAWLIESTVALREGRPAAAILFVIGHGGLSAFVLRGDIEADIQASADDDPRRGAIDGPGMYCQHMEHGLPGKPSPGLPLVN